MRINHRPYRDREDLFQIGRLIRRAHAQAPLLQRLELCAL